MAELPPILILRLRNMTAIDATGLQALQKLADSVRASGRTLILCGAREQPALMMRRSEFAQHVGGENICTSVAAALERARNLHAVLSLADPSSGLPEPNAVGLESR